MEHAAGHTGNGTPPVMAAAVGTAHPTGFRSADYADYADCGDFQRNIYASDGRMGPGAAPRPGARVCYGLAATRRGAAGFRVSLPAAPGFLVFVPPLDRRAALPRRPSFAQATVGTAHPTGCRQDACGTSQGRDSRRRGRPGRAAPAHFVNDDRPQITQIAQITQTALAGICEHLRHLRIVKV